MPKKRARLTEDNDPLNSTDQVLASLEQLSHSTSQQVDKQTSQKADKLTRQEVRQETIPKDNKPLLRKATFQLRESVLTQLEKFHLELKLELGRNNTPYKETIVEEAISQLLAQAHQDKDKVLRNLQQRQRKRK